MPGEDQLSVWCLQVLSTKEQRHIRKKARRKAARANNASESATCDEPDVPCTASAPPDPPAAAASDQEHSKVRALHALLLVCFVGESIDCIWGKGTAFAHDVAIVPATKMLLLRCATTTMQH